MTASDFERFYVNQPQHSRLRLPEGHRRGRPSSLAPIDVLGLCLHCLCDAAPDHLLCRVFGITPTVLIRDRADGMAILLAFLEHYELAQVIWPSTREMCTYYSGLVESLYPLFTGCVGYMDGTAFMVEESTDPIVQAREHNPFHFRKASINCVFCTAPDGTILWCSLNNPGTWHDSLCAMDCYQQLLYNTPRGFYILTDNGFAKSGPLNSRIIQPPNQFILQHLSLDAGTRQAQRTSYRWIITIRQAAEWFNAGFKACFARLKSALPSNPQARLQILKICVFLFQVRTRLVGINEIRTRYFQVFDQDIKLDHPAGRLARFYQDIDDDSDYASE